jgi:hypothetical protein
MNRETLETFHIIAIHGALITTSRAMVKMWRLERIIFGSLGIAMRASGMRATPASDQRIVSVVETISSTISLYVRVVDVMNRIASATVRGSKAELTRNPIVPYLRAQRYQRRLEHIAKTAAMLAVFGPAPKSRPAAYDDAGTRAKSKRITTVLYD